MAELFLYYIDMAVLGLCVVVTLMITIILTKQASVLVRRVPLFLLLFGNTLIVLFLLCNYLFEISFTAFTEVIEGTFEYTFRFYSLLLIGILFLSISIYMLWQVRIYLSGDRTGRKNFIRAAIILSLLSATGCPFAHIGLIPGIACVISLGALPFAVRQKQDKLQLEEV